MDGFDASGRGMSLMEKWAMIRRLRDKLPAGHVSQERLAELDRELFAREEVGRDPLGAPSMVGLTLADYMAKKLDPDRGRSPASVGQVGAGIKGVLGGLGDWGRGVLSGGGKR